MFGIITGQKRHFHYPLAQLLVWFGGRVNHACKLTRRYSPPVLLLLIFHVAAKIVFVDTGHSITDSSAHGFNVTETKRYHRGWRWYLLYSRSHGVCVRNQRIRHWLTCNWCDGVTFYTKETLTNANHGFAVSSMRWAQTVAATMWIHHCPVQNGFARVRWFGRRSMQPQQQLKEIIHLFAVILTNITTR